MKQKAIQKLLEAMSFHRKQASQGDSMSSMILPRLGDLLRQVRRSSGSELINLVEIHELLEDR